MFWSFPLAFWLIIPWCVLLLYYFFKGRNNRSVFRVSSLSGVKHTKTLRTYFFWLPDILLFLSMLFLIMALARPQKVDSQNLRSAEGVDIMIVLDTSDSMLIEDMNPNNRIEAAKRVIKNFIKGLVFDRVGLVVFSGESYTKVPLTLDYGMLLRSLDTVEVSHYDPHIKPGTAIGVALANAVVRLKKSQAKSKVIVFLTDGENNAGVITPQTALDIVKRYNIKAYTIGVGARDGITHIPRKIKDIHGRKIVNYQTLETKINEELLKQIAEETGGKYFRANSTKSLDTIFSEISQLEKSEVKLTEWKQYEELFPKFLEKAILIFLASLLLSFSIFWRVV